MKLFLLILLVSITTNILAFTYNNGEKDSFVFIPGFSYTTADGIKLNGTLLYYDKTYSTSFPNAIKTVVSYGSDSEFSFGLGTSRYFSNQHYIASGSFTTGKYPSTLYYPISGSPDEKKSESYLSYNNYFSIGLGVKKFKEFYFGPTYTFAYYKIVEKEEGGILDNNEITGSKNTIASGIGFTISREKRENSYYPSKGYYLSLNNYFYPKFLGSNTIYDTTALTFKYFHKLFYNVIFGYQIYTRAIFGNAPFQKLSKLGGSGILRGYSSAKYSDRRYFATQVEIRYPVFWRVSGTAFVGTAQITNSFLNYFDYPWKLAGGVGFRFRLDKKQNINFRLDFAWNIEGDLHIYITSLEAF